MTDKRDHIEEEIWFSSVDENELAKYNKEAAFAAFKQRVAEHEQQSGRSSWTSQASKSSGHWLKYAAAIATLLIVVSYFSYQGGQSQLEAQMSDIVIEAPQGSRSLMTLPDGSKVWLNAGSKISYSQGFCIVNRLVSIEGEGYFEVARNEQLPFSVKSDNVVVKVLGTKFNFRDYPSDATATVSLSEGSVAMNSVTRPKDDRLLKPGERATVDKKTGKIRVEQYDVANAIQWTNGKIIFDGEPLRDIINDLERAYNVSIIVRNSELYGLRFYGDFVRQEQSLSEVLDALVATGKIKYEIKGQQITLY